MAWVRALRTGRGGGTCPARARPPYLGRPARRLAVDAAKILWAEDSVSDQVLIRAAVEGARGADSIQFVPDGVALLEALQATQPALVVLDLEMPRMGGLETLRAIRADPRLRSIRVVIFTTSNLPSDVSACRQLGAEHVLQKPVDFAVFRMLVLGILSRLQLLPDPAKAATGTPKRNPRAVL